MSKLKDIFVSAVIVIPDGRNDAIEKLAEIEKILSGHYTYFELLVIDSEANSNEFSTQMEQQLKKIPKMRYIRLFNIMSEKVLFAAGMENAIGDIVVASYPEYYTEENVTKAVELCCAGNDLVSGVTPRKKPFLHTVGGLLFRKLFGQMISYKLPSNDTLFRCVSRRLINASLNLNHFHEFVFLKLSNAGGEQAELTLQSTGDIRPTDSIRSELAKAVTLLVFNTTTPLRIMNTLAILSSFTSLLFAIYSVVIKLLKQHVIEGWTTLMLVLSGLFFMLFLILSFIGEYLVRLITDHGTPRPYNVIFEKHSSVMLNYEKLNIREESVSSEINLTQTGRDR